MLKLAINYKEKLDNLAKTIIPYNDKYRYFNNSSYYEYNFYIDTVSSCYNIDYVVVDINDDVIGFIGANVDRDNNKISGLRVINFKNNSYTFSKNILEFINMLFFKMNFNKIEFLVVIGNSAEKLYDKFIDMYGGKIVGIERESVKLEDNNLYDVKHYEILKKEFKRRA